MRPLRMLRRAREEHGRDRPHQGALLDEAPRRHRVFFVCGIRALRDYEARIRETRAVSALLSAKSLEISSAVERVLAESAAKDARDCGDEPHDLRPQGRRHSCSGDAARRPGGRLHPFELRQFCVQLSEAKKAPFIAVMSETEPGVAMSYVCAIPDDLLRPREHRAQQAPQRPRRRCEGASCRAVGRRTRPPSGRRSPPSGPSTPLNTNIARRNGLDPIREPPRLYEHQ